MTVMFFDSVEGIASTMSTSWVERASKTGLLGDGEYMIWVYAEYGGDLVTYPVGVRVLVDGVEKAFDYHRPELVGQYKSFSAFGMLTVSGAPDDGESHTISIEYVSNHATQTAYIRRVRLLVMKH